MTLSIQLSLSEEQAAQLGGKVLLIVSLTPEELVFLGNATVAQAQYIEATLGELAAQLLREEALGTADDETMRQLRSVVSEAGALASAAALVADILRRRLIVAPGDGASAPVQWGRA